MTTSIYEQSPPQGQFTGEQLLGAGSELLAHFGVEADPMTEPDKFRAALKQLDPRYQEERKLVRWELEADQTDWDDATKDVIDRTAESMRMHEKETFLKGKFDAVIVLGGARQSNLDRADYAAGSIVNGYTKAKQLIIAGSGRELEEAERKNTGNYALGAETEFDLCAGAAATVAKRYKGLAPGTQYITEKKAGTPDVIQEVLATMKENDALSADSRIAAVTTQIYQVSTALDLARVAREFGVTQTFTAGNPSDPNIVAKRTPATYLSEILRTLRAAVNDVESQQAAKAQVAQVAGAVSTAQAAQQS